MVGAAGDDEHKGAAYLYERLEDGSWTEAAKLNRWFSTNKDVENGSQSQSGGMYYTQRVRGVSRAFFGAYYSVNGKKMVCNLYYL